MFRLRFFDDFTRANIGANWSNAGGSGATISGNQLIGGAGGASDNFALAPQFFLPGTQWCEATFISTSNTTGDNDDGGPIVCQTISGGPQSNGYVVNVVSLPGLSQTQYNIFQVTNNSGTALTLNVAGGTTGTIGRALVSGDRIMALRSGSTIYFFLNGVMIDNSTDSTWQGGGTGMHLFSNTNVWDNFACGDTEVPARDFRHFPPAYAMR